MHTDRRSFLQTLLGTVISICSLPDDETEEFPATALPREDTQAPFYPTVSRYGVLTVRGTDLKFMCRDFAVTAYNSGGYGFNSFLTIRTAVGPTALWQQLCYRMIPSAYGYRSPMVIVTAEDGSRVVFKYAILESYSQAAATEQMTVVNDVRLAGWVEHAISDQ